MQLAVVRRTGGLLASTISGHFSGLWWLLTLPTWSGRASSHRASMTSRQHVKQPHFQMGKLNWEGI